MKNVCALLLMSGLVACLQSEAKPNTQIVISVSTDYDVPDALDAVRFQVEKQSATAYEPPRYEDTISLVDKGAPKLPLTMALTSVAAGKPTVRVTVQGYRDGAVLLQRQAIVSFRSGQTLSLPMNLLRICENVMCQPGVTTCGDEGACEPIARSDLETWKGRPPEPDGGARSYKVIALSTGFDHSCAVMRSGHVYCWGGNGKNQLGSATEPAQCPGQDFPCSPEPVLVPGIEDAIQVGTGEEFSCALSRGGGIWCWGANDSGQIGSAKGFGDYPPTRVRLQTALGELYPMLEGANALGVGRIHACARVAKTKGLVCWGGAKNEFHQIPIAGASQASSAAVQTDVKQGVERFALGHLHGCFTDTAGALFCWGWNESGQLGLDLATKSTAQPHQIFASKVTEFALGAAHTCAIVDGAIRCFGLAQPGQLGIGPLPALPDCYIGPCSITPRSVDTTIASEPLALALGSWSSCARYADGRAGCWGDNTGFQSGQVWSERIFSPVYVPDPRGVRLIASLADHVCIATERDQIFCWGANGQGQLGPNATIGTSTAELSEVSIPDKP